MKRARLIPIFAVLILSGIGLTALMAARGNGERPPANSGEPERNMFVVILGEVDTPDRTVEIYPDNFPMSSRVTGVLVNEGEEVKKGQHLLQFDNEALINQVKVAENAVALATWEKAKAESMVRAHTVQVNALEKELKAKQAELEQRQSEYKEAEHAYRVVKSKNLLELESAAAAVRVAELNLESAKIKWEGLKAEVPNYLVDIAKDSIKRAELLKAQAEHARDLMACKAPADGRIIRSFVAEGKNFGPMSREPAFWFLKKGPLLVRAEVTQEFAARVVLGQPAEIKDEANGSQQWTGRVSKVGDQFLPKRSGGSSAFDFMPVNDDRVLECHISVDLRPGEVGPKFGQKVRVSIPVR